MKLVADLHVHTLASGHAYATVEEVIVAASRRGLKLVGLTDHGPGLSGGAHPYHFWNLRVLPRKVDGVILIRGVEANIMNLNGELDLEEDVLGELDLVAVGLHPYLGYDGRKQKEYTGALLKVMENPLVDIVVHPGNPNFPIDIDEVVASAKEHDKLLEINNSSFLSWTSRSGAYELDLELAKKAFEAGLTVTINSDAHQARAVGEFEHAVDLASKAGFSDERVLNSSVQKVTDFLGRRGSLNLEAI